MKKVAILIVDDHKLIREAYALVLSRFENFEVVGTTQEGEQAIEISRQKQPDIVLLDTNLGPLNGLEILKSIRKYSPSTKVIIVSLYIQPSFVRKMLSNGAKGFLSKNSSVEEMLKAIHIVSEKGSYVSDDIKDYLTKNWAGNNEDVPAGIDVLSTRELEVIKLIREGHSSKEIGVVLHIGAKTVEVHRHNILKKLKVKNTAALIDFVHTCGL